MSNIMNANQILTVLIVILLIALLGAGGFAIYTVTKKGTPNSSGGSSTPNSSGGSTPTNQNTVASQADLQKFAERLNTELNAWGGTGCDIVTALNKMPSTEIKAFDKVYRAKYNESPLVTLRAQWVICPHSTADEEFIKKLENI